MREELKDIEVSAVQGGTVVLSAPLKMVSFTKLQQIAFIKGDPKEMRNRLLELYDANEHMDETEFDILVRDDFKAHGWI